MIGAEHERQRLEAGVAAAARSLDGRAFEFEAPVGPAPRRVSAPTGCPGRMRVSEGERLGALWKR